ncbi:MAG TPA: ThiF family adenylyltransferase [Ktedonobacteraceae bacterium]|nr:ThiF family adenylyltransferase [Ktedonobacteraceae bacterium]
MTTLDLTASHTAVAYQGNHVRLFLVGVGGTGSLAAFPLIQMVRRFNQRWNQAMHPRDASLTLVDYDLVEPKNVEARQHFYPFEVGAPKAQVLANRLRLGFTLKRNEIHAKVMAFSPNLLPLAEADTLIILIGCVDNPEARQCLAHCLENQPAPSRIWWVDAGNENDYGQVYSGNTAQLADLRGSLASTPCQLLPSPALLAPALVKSAPAAAHTVRSFACGDIQITEAAQSGTINLHMAGLVVHYVAQLLEGSLSAFATYTTLRAAGTGVPETRSEPITALGLARALGQKKPEAFARSLLVPASAS